jgi:hypothetical protein
MSASTNFTLRENEEGSEVVHEIGVKQLDDSKSRIFHIFPVVDGELVFEKSRVETMDGKVTEKSVDEEIFEQAQDWLHD